MIYLSMSLYILITETEMTFEPPPTTLINFRGIETLGKGLGPRHWTQHDFDMGSKLDKCLHHFGSNGLEHWTQSESETLRIQILFITFCISLYILLITTCHIFFSL